MMIDWPVDGRVIEILVPSLTVNRIMEWVAAAVAVRNRSGDTPNSKVTPTRTAPPAIIAESGRAALPEVFGLMICSSLTPSLHGFLLDLDRLSRRRSRPR